MSWWFAFGKPRRGKAGRPGPPVHEDRVQRVFSADRPNRLWLTYITERPTAQGKLCLCAIKDVHSHRIVDYAMDARMQSRLAVAALELAVARRAIAGHDVAGCIVHSDCGSQFRSRRYLHALGSHGLVGSTGRVGAAGDNATMESFFALLQKNVRDRQPWGDSAAAADRDRHLDRTHLPPPRAASRPRPPHTLEYEMIEPAMATQAA